MTAAGFAWITALALAAGPEPADLVARLGSPRFAAREAANRALEALGRDALPALDAARASKDPEVRARVATLIERIESGMMVQPTRVKLDIADRPLAEVVRGLGRQLEPPLAIVVPESGPGARRLTVHAGRTLPFWEALDRLCLEGRLAPVLVPTAGVDGQGPAVGIVLTAIEGRAAPASYSGPFRVSVARLQRSHEIVLEPGAARQADDDRFQVHLQVLAEPRLIVGRAGEVRLLEAVDDLGQSLIPEPSGRADFLSRRLDALDVDFDPVEFAAGAALQVPIALAYPEHPGRSVRRLRGTFPVVLATRRAGPAVVPLGDAEGRTFAGRDLAVTIHTVRPDPNDPQVILELTIRTLGHDAAATDPIDPWTPAFLEHQIEVLDRQGRAMTWVPQQIDQEDRGARIALVVVGDGGAAPARLRVFGLSRARTEVAFDFHGLRMP